MPRSKGKSVKVTEKVTGNNSRILSNALAAIKQPRIDTRNAKLVERRIFEYFEYCAENDISPSVAGCSNWLGLSTSTLRSWYSGLHGTPEHQKVATMFYGILQDVWAQDMHEGNINPVTGIFLGKSMYGYKDTQEIVVHNTGANSQLSVADLIAESKMLPGGDNVSGDVIDAEMKEVAESAETEKAAERPQKGAERETPGAAADT